MHSTHCVIPCCALTELHLLVVLASVRWACLLHGCRPSQTPDAARKQYCTASLRASQTMQQCRFHPFASAAIFREAMYKPGFSADRYICCSHHDLAYDDDIEYEIEALRLPLCHCSTIQPCVLGRRLLPTS